MIPLSALRKNFPKGVKPPDKLVALLEFSNGCESWFSGDFEFSGSPSLEHWFDGDKKAAAQFIEFGDGSNGGRFAYWMYDGRTVDNAPIVFLGSEGDSTLVADNFDDFLSLLAVGVAELGVEANGGGFDPPETPAPYLAEFQEWLKTTYGIEAPSDPLGLLEKARANHPDIFAWISKWQRERVSPKG